MDFNLPNFLQSLFAKLLLPMPKFFTIRITSGSFSGSAYQCQLTGQWVICNNNFDPVSTLLPIQHLLISQCLLQVLRSPMIQRTVALSRGGLRYQFVVAANCGNNDSDTRRKIRYHVR